MASVKHRVGIDGAIEKIFTALTTSDGLAGWWASSAEIHGGTGGQIELTFDRLAVLKFKYKTIQENQVVQFQCIEGPGPWHDSSLLFELEQGKMQVFLTMTHQSDTASEEDCQYFNTKWVCYLLSLRDYVETGRGRPYPNDVKIHVGD